MMTAYSLCDLSSIKVSYEKYSSKRGDAPLSGAFASDDTLTLSVRVPRALCACAALLRLYRDDDMTTREITAELFEFDIAHDVYRVVLALSDICTDGESGLFYYTFMLDTPYGTLYTDRDGTLNADGGAVSCEQLTVYEPSLYVPSKFRGGMMYQIFVDRFFDGGRPIVPEEGKVRNPDWEHGVPMYAEKPGDALANNEFFGGNLWGVADKLDYIASLGVDTLYLCPIFEAASNHKYDTGDYMKIDRMFGGSEAFDRLVSECKTRGMRLILDGVFNHTGADSRYFNKFGRYDGPGAYNSKRSKYYKWYSFDEYPDEYNCWWGVKILPAVKSEEPTYREFINGEKGVIRHYLRRGIDGWRLDVADELSDVFLDELKAAARAENSEALVLGEVWEDASNKVAYDKRRRYFRGRQLDSVMNYPLKEAVIEYVLSGDSTRLCMTSRELWAHYPEAVSHVLMNFLGTHDTERILTVLADVGTKNMSNRELAGFRLNQKQRRLAKKRLKFAWALLAAFPGMPCIYYGDEAGMEGGRDPFNRMPYVWGREDAELGAFYRKIGAIRRNEPLFSDGSLEIIDTGDTAQFMLCREYGGRRLVAVANLSGRPWELEFETPPKRLLGKGRCGDTVIIDDGAVEYFIL
ncbi:MAG: glycoside hydrolase family 13 protein [Clostridia bacterium]|nr:glycoside hydrolase family 13 protein [Clostridia bacterium]